ncbi:transcriptional regulator, XRE family [Desulfovibrio sp. X2]|uniref:helix-turn-helix domain-containing protein n=1 Tax=Desulfovibrio sp. X2 TaxID=941449 RepID=UPI00035873E6|nr:helix-turn-helix domain-containing protein [Desulfovibrio sp. X2]EPR42327.1 transcriptional regulator, XRE family [Desulfovibrio sp. X2]
MELQELGEMLRQRREALGLSLDEVVERTKISRRNLQSIEEGRQDEMPHPVYSKGFIRNYARVLEVDLDEVNAALIEIFPEEEDENEATAQEVQRDLRLHSGGSGKGGGLLKAFLLLLLLAAVAAAVVWFLPGRKAKTTTPEAPKPGVTAPAPSSSSAQPPVQAVPAPAAPAQSPENAPEAAPKAEPAPGGQAKPEASAPAGQTSSAAPAATAVPSAETAQTVPVKQAPAVETAEKPEPQKKEVAQAATSEKKPEAKGKPGTVQVTAREACWLEAVAENGEAQEFFLRPGEKLTVDYTSSLILRIGNAGGISVTNNGKPVRFEAKSGEVKTLTFP